MKFEARVKYTHLDPISGREKSVSETYLLEAETFGDAEIKTMKYMEIVTNSTVIATIKKSDIAEEIGDLESEKFYKATVKQSVIDELTGKESNQNVSLLIGDMDIDGALTLTNSWCSESIYDTEITKIGLSGIIGII